MNPIVAIMLGHFVAAEPITLRTILGASPRDWQRDFYDARHFVVKAALLRLIILCWFIVKWRERRLPVSEYSALRAEILRYEGLSIRCGLFEECRSEAATLRSSSRRAHRVIPRHGCVEPVSISPRDGPSQSWWRDLPELPDRLPPGESLRRGRCRICVRRGASPQSIWPRSEAPRRMEWSERTRLAAAHLFGELLVFF